MRMKKSSDTILNWRAPTHGTFVWSNIPPTETNALDLDLL